MNRDWLLIEKTYPTGSPWRPGSIAWTPVEWARGASQPAAGQGMLATLMVCQAVRAARTDGPVFCVLPSADKTTDESEKHSEL